MKDIELSPEAKRSALEEIKAFFLDEHDQEISDFQASAVLQFVLIKIAPQIYNQAIADAHRLLTDRIEDLFALEKRPR